MTYYCGVSLAPAPDVCTFVAVQMAALPPAQPRYEVQVAHIWEPHTTLPALIGTLEGRLSQPPLRGRSQLIVEAPAACRPWIDQIRQASLQLVAVQLQEGGAAPSHVGSNWVVSPALLAGTQELLLQMDRLHLSADLPNLAVLTEEIQAFRRIRDGTAPPPRRLPLSLAAALACWWGERVNVGRVPPLDLSRGIQNLWKSPIGPRPLHPRRFFRGDYRVLDEDFDA
jgi:hypothetical protein